MDGPNGKLRASEAEKPLALKYRTSSAGGGRIDMRLSVAPRPGSVHRRIATKRIESVSAQRRLHKFRNPFLQPEHWLRNHSPPPLRRRGRGPEQAPGQY